MMARDADGETPLHSACRHGRLCAIQCLTNRKANVNLKDENGETPFFEAVRSGATVVLKMLLEARADPGQTTHNGSTALHLAAARGGLRMASIIIDIPGFPLQAFNSERQTALHVAVKFQHPLLVNLILPHCQEICDAIDVKGMTPLSITGCRVRPSRYCCESLPRIPQSPDEHACDSSCGGIGL